MADQESHFLCPVCGHLLTRHESHFSCSQCHYQEADFTNYIRDVLSMFSFRNTANGGYEQDSQHGHSDSFSFVAEMARRSKGAVYFTIYNRPPGSDLLTVIAELLKQHGVLDESDIHIWEENPTRDLECPFCEGGFHISHNRAICRCHRYQTTMTNAITSIVTAHSVYRFDHGHESRFFFRSSGERPTFSVTVYKDNDGNAVRVSQLPGSSALATPTINLIAQKIRDYFPDTKVVRQD